MIVKSFELEKLKLLNFNMHLIYGVNEGIQQYIIENFYLKNFNGELLKYDEQEIFNKREEFISSLLTKSLFTNNKLVIISRASDKSLGILKEILDKDDLRDLMLREKDFLAKLFQSNSVLFTKKQIVNSES